MNPQYEKQLEAGVRRELEALGELPAPPALAKRILRAVEARAAAPWYQKSWSAWPWVLRSVSLTTLLLAFGGLCLGAWALTHAATVPAWVSSASAEVWGLWRALGVVASTAGALIARLGTGVLIGAAAVSFAAWVTCIGLGTAFVRLALRPAVNRI